MPEGPEIRRAADRVGAALAGRAAEEVYFGLPCLAGRGEELAGRTVERVEARGKAMVVGFAGGLSVYSHNQLYGRWMVRPPRDLPETGRSLRFAVHNERASALLYSASEIELLDDEGLRRHSYLSRLGPDPLEPAVTPEQIVERALLPERRRRALGGLLLDQGFVAGIGNYLRSEILFVARLHPARRPADLDAAELAVLGEQAVELPRRSYATGGVTNDPRRVEELRAQGAPRRRYRHAVFAQAGRPCPRCAGRVEKTVAAGRRLYLCPSCQPRGGAG